MANHYDIPTWAGKPPVGTHLDVMKEDKLVQKLMLDEKKCYLFGRNPQMNDICIDHQSCSRVHAAFVYHKHLQRAFLVDLGSTHGTFIGSLRLESHKPTQLPPDSTFHFGASTRNYIMRGRPGGGARGIIEQLEGAGETGEGAAMLGLPQTSAELDNLTEFNTAHNRRISMLGIGSAEAEAAVRPKRRRRSVTFSEEEEVINPEDVDPSVGRFRDMVHTTVIPTKRNRFDGIGPTSGLTHEEVKFVHLKHFSHPTAQLYTDLPHPDNTQQQSVSLPQTSSSILSSVLASRLGISLPNPAPEVEMIRHVAVAPVVVNQVVKETDTDNSQPKKKKYAKESWPGKKTVPTLLV
ncbi:unnamed protein product [Nezara viridula]|uniref:Nuclear inhibitor of protein phosphatase 1 n=1 Tax=Nezara viridula TaxID=85310 RepID=A0A9P0E387_NEZVI|nr:unnamed protein product [Nezara viridula]